MKCAKCDFEGIIGRTLLGRAAGMIVGVQIKRVDYLCADCTVKVPIDSKHTDGDRQ